MEQYMYGVVYGVLGERLAFDRPHTEPPIRGGTLASVLNELSGRGWEFVSMSSPGNSVVCIMRKRTLPSAPTPPGQS